MNSTTKKKAIEWLSSDAIALLLAALVVGVAIFGMLTI